MRCEDCSYCIPVEQHGSVFVWNCSMQKELTEEELHSFYDLNADGCSHFEESALQMTDIDGKKGRCPVCEHVHRLDSKSDRCYFCGIKLKA